MAEKPFRLVLPSPDSRVARSAFEDGTVIGATPILTHVPIVQWTSIRIRIRISGAGGTLNALFVRPNRSNNPDNAFGEAFQYGQAQPAIDGTVLADGVEQSLDITQTEHQGENWLQIAIDANGATVDFCDVSGELVGNYH